MRKIYVYSLPEKMITTWACGSIDHFLNHGFLLTRKGWGALAGLRPQSDPFRPSEPVDQPHDECVGLGDPVGLRRRLYAVALQSPYDYPRGQDRHAAVAFRSPETRHPATRHRSFGHAL